MLNRLAALAVMGTVLGLATADTEAQDAARPGLTGAEHPADVILARRILMTGIGRFMDEITYMTEPGVTLEPEHVVEAADVISTMLLAFPHLFPPETDNWTQELEEADPARVSLSLPAVWESFDDFYRRAQAASQLALDTSRARTEADFRAKAIELQAACDGCHQQYRRNWGDAAIPIAP
jgi:cytochrome c556